jgi:hypothetical protein
MSLSIDLVVWHGAQTRGAAALMSKFKDDLSAVHRDKAISYYLLLHLKAPMPS